MKILEVSVEQHKKIKLLAVKTNRSIKNLVSEAIEAIIKKYEKYSDE